MKQRRLKWFNVSAASRTWSEVFAALSGVLFKNTILKVLKHLVCEFKI